MSFVLPSTPSQTEDSSELISVLHGHYTIADSNDSIISLPSRHSQINLAVNPLYQSESSSLLSRDRKLSDSEFYLNGTSRIKISDTNAAPSGDMLANCSTNQRITFQDEISRTYPEAQPGQPSHNTGFNAIPAKTNNAPTLPTIVESGGADVLVEGGRNERKSKIRTMDFAIFIFTCLVAFLISINLGTVDCVCKGSSHVFIIGNKQPA